MIERGETAARSARMLDANRQALRHGFFKDLPAVGCRRGRFGIVNRVGNKLIQRQERPAELEPELLDSECIDECSVPRARIQTVATGQAVEAMAGQVGTTAARQGESVDRRDEPAGSAPLDLTRVPGIPRRKPHGGRPEAWFQDRP